MGKRPNVVFVLTDDQGYGDLGCTGNPILKTPNINNFYEESLRFTDFHVGPTCAPTRSGLMTGHYANSTGVWHTVGGRSLLRRDEVTLASALKSTGYRTGIFGKWHLGDAYPYRPMDRGFEETVVLGGGGISQTPDYWGNDYFDDTYFTNGVPKEYEGYCTDVFFDEAIGFIEKNKDTPFFCYIAANAPHEPFNVESKYSKEYEGLTNDDRARFYGMITNIDDNFAKLRRKLAELEIEDNTILIFMTDNGTSCGINCDACDFAVDGYNAGLRGMKNSEYDGGHRVPFFMKYNGGGIGGGEDIDSICANVDFMPTILDLCGLTDTVTSKKFPGLSFHGKSLLPIMKTLEIDEDRVIVTDSQRVAYPVKWRKSSVMTYRWRLVNGRELYDIQHDREQRYDIGSKHPEIVADLRNEYEKWWDIVSEQYDSIIPFYLENKPVHITCHDLRNEESKTAWNQKLIRDGLSIDGYYEIDVVEKGEYRFEIRRWPKSHERSICKGIDGDDIHFEKNYIQQKKWDFYQGGKELDVQYAQISIQGQEVTLDVNGDVTFVMAEFNLDAGETRLYCRFLNDKKQCITSAYYIDIYPESNK